jgi:hypothetical protein
MIGNDNKDNQSEQNNSSKEDDSKLEMQLLSMIQ